jgi:hypothetical protein
VHSADESVGFAPSAIAPGQWRKPRRERAYAFTIEFLVAKKDHGVLVESVSNLRKRRIIEARKIDIEDFGTNRAREGLDPDFRILGEIVDHGRS